MSGGSLCVLALNGRRQTVKCTPNTTILQVLEEVCRKQQLKPEEFDLKHHNKILDTTTTFRFSGLPNNAQLELVPATKLRCETEITLAVNLENGTRLMGNFLPSDTLLHILNHLCPECLGDDKNPVVIYTRREMYGKELESVTLRALGLTGGRAMVRLINKSPEELKVQANVAAPLPSKPVEEKPYQRKFQPLAVAENENNENIENSTGEGSGEERAEPKTEPGTRPERIQKNANVDLLKLAREKRKNLEFTSPKREEKRINVKEEQAESAAGPEKTDQCLCRDDLMEVDDCGNCQENCTDVERNIEEEFIFLDERNAMLFSLETAQSLPSEDLPDNFFDLTINDARGILRDIKRQKTTDAPLMTSAMRELEESKKMLKQLNRYKKAVIRVLFPDRTVLQGIFQPSETIKDVIEFVRGYLEEQGCNFYLYSTPPKCILEESKTLIQLGFLPGALIHFGMNSLTKPSSFLKRDLKDKFTSNSVASLAASKMRNEYTRTCISHEVEDDPESDENSGSNYRHIANDGASTSTATTYGQRKIERSTEKVPKWFRP
ncbi:tether containing UBX domain for GLUT4 [Leptinotarsa decemlineata]|uniref:tether containing UBX domain for GLUT4 n=1 Tax=Leptinotarsa decemlineata TaxID=7539 RepID=UPI003D307EFD